MVHAKKEDKVLEVRRNPSKHELNWFGVVVFVMMGFLGFIAWGKGHLIFKTGGAPPIMSYVFWGIGVVLPVVYYAIPPLRKKLYVGFMYVLYPIGFVMSHIILGAIYFLMFTPVGFVMRRFGYDPMNKRYAPEATTYFHDHVTGGDAPRYFRQF
jgi:hypothetical protein